jgi:ferredoxin
MFTKKFIKFDDFEEGIKLFLKTYDVFSPVKVGENYSYQKLGAEDEIKSSEYRTQEPIKSFFLSAKEDLQEIADKKILILNAKACDLKSLKILDWVFGQGEFRDPIYLKKRENSIIISSDCTSFKEVCFCTSLNYKPYPEEGFDLNLSPLKDGYILEIASEKGEKLVENFSLKEPTEAQIKEMQDNRKLISEKVKQNAERFISSNIYQNLADSVRKGFDSEIWDEESQRCVECGGCTNICPTCHCFFLIYKKDGLERLRAWDSCLYKSYAQVAGGANPRKKLSQRLRNRFIKKFDYFPFVLQEYACTGCGRCVEVCMGKIDIREILNKLAGPE